MINKLCFEFQVQNLFWWRRKVFGHPSEVFFYISLWQPPLREVGLLRAMPKIVTMALTSHGSCTVPPCEVSPPFWVAIMQTMSLTLFKALLSGYLRKSIFLLHDIKCHVQPDHPSYQTSHQVPLSYFQKLYSAPQEETLALLMICITI